MPQTCCDIWTITSWNIRRVIFYSLKKIVMNEKGEKEIKTISTSQAWQIGGRAGRFGKFPEGLVTTFRSEDLSILKNIWYEDVKPLEKAGLYPTAEQLEDLSYQLPKESMSNLVDIFKSSCSINTSYFMCVTEGFQFLATKIQHIPLPHRAMRVFCCAPVDTKWKFILTMFEKFAKQYDQNQPLTFEQLCQKIKWPFSPPNSIGELDELENIFDVLELYLWFSIRFPGLFPHVTKIRSIKNELDEIIQQGVLYITHLRATKATDGLEDQVEDKGFSKLSKYVPSVSTDSIEMAKMFEDPSHMKFDILTRKLLYQERITPETFRILQKEWKDMEKSDSSLHPFDKINSRGFRKTKKKRSECSM